VHRGNQYVRAVQLYYRKTGHYPGSVDQLEKTNNIRFLRQRYVDPMTGKPDWRLIHVGEAKTTLKGFFGQPLAGIASTGLGSAAGMASSGGRWRGASGSSPFGSSSLGSSPGSGLSSGSGTSSLGGSSLGSSGRLRTTHRPGDRDGQWFDCRFWLRFRFWLGISSQSATSFTGTGAPIMGIGSSKTGNSIIVLNEQTTYPTWEFIYDPRIEQLKAKASLLGGGASSTNATGLGGNSRDLVVAPAQALEAAQALVRRLRRRVGPAPLRRRRLRNRVLVWQCTTKS